MTQSEASALAGTTFSAGKEETTSGGGKICIYGGQTTNIFEVIVGQAPDAATAQAEWSQEQTKAQDELKKGVPAGVKLTVKTNDASISGADKAATASIQASFSGVALSGAVLYLLKGAVFVGVSDIKVGGNAPSVTALEAQGGTTVSRLP